MELKPITRIKHRSVPRYSAQAGTEGHGVMCPEVIENLFLKVGHVEHWLAGVSHHTGEPTPTPYLQDIDLGILHPNGETYRSRFRTGPEFELRSD